MRYFAIRLIGVFLIGMSSSISEAAQDLVISPRIAVLQLELAKGNGAALDSFWQDITISGTPLIESIPKDTTNMIVTFLWRTQEPVTNVVVASSITGWDITKSQLHRLLDTDLWYKSYRVRKDARTKYQFSPNDPLTDFESRLEFLTGRSDPLNPRQFILPRIDTDSTSRDEVFSVLELPGAPIQPYVAPRPGSPTGNVERHAFKSTILNNERALYIYTPSGYTTRGKPYHLLIMFDAEVYTKPEVIPTPTILDNLISDGRIPPVVAVFMQSQNPNGATRDRELPCYPPFAEFLAQELVPWVRQEYNVTRDPRQTVIGGASYGGLAATFAGLQHSELFGKVLSQSGSFWWKPVDDPEAEWLTRQFVASAKLPLQFYIEVGLFEPGSLMIVTNRHMRDVLRAKGYEVHYAEFNGGHDGICWRGTLADGLIALIGTRKEATNGNGKAVQHGK